MIADTPGEPVIFDEAFAGAPLAADVPFVDAAVLPGGRRLLAAGTRGVALLEADGSFVHRFRVPATALVVHDDGATAIALWPEGDRQQLTKIDVRTHRTVSWGSRRIARFCRSFDARGWTTLSGDHLEAWDLTGPEPRVSSQTPLALSALCGATLGRARGSDRVVLTTEAWGQNRDDLQLERRLVEGGRIVASRALYLATAEAGAAENRVEYRVDGYPTGSSFFREPDGASMVHGYQRLAGVLSFRTEATVSLVWSGLEGTGTLRVLAGDRLEILAALAPVPGAKLCASDEREGYLVVADDRGRSATLRLRRDA